MICVDNVTSDLWMVRLSHLSACVYPTVGG